MRRDLPRRSPRPLPAMSEEEAVASRPNGLLSAELRSGAAAALAPYRKVSFRPEPGSKLESDSRLLRWIGVGVLLGALFGFWFVVIRPAIGGLRAQRPAPSPMEIYNDVLRADLQASEDALRSFYRADSVDALLGFVREASALEEVIRAHYKAKPPRATEIEILGSMTRVHHFDESFVLAVVRHPGTPERGRQVAVQLSEEGAKVDWELATNVQRAAWEKFPEVFAETPRSTPFRVELDDGEYYNLDYDEKNWVCFRVTAPEVDKPVYAYAVRSSPLAERLLGLVNLEEPRPAQVVASFAGADRDEVVRQLRILDLVSDQWLVPGESLPLGGPVDPQHLASYN